MKTVRRPRSSSRPAPRAVVLSRRRSTGSVLVVVMITIIFAAAALVIFMDKASNDLLVEQRDAVTRRLRIEAYSALEVTLAVLEDFRQAGGNALHSTAEGWGDPLGFAGYTPADDRKVTISFEDESGKISLPRTTPVVLTSLFKSWDIPENDAEALSDAITGWTKREHIYTSGLAPSYEQSTLPFEEPRRSIRAFEELAAIDKVREVFFTEGQPNHYWKRFVDAVSLFDFQRPNVNGARGDTLAAVALFDPTQQQTIADYLNGTGSYQTQGPGYFRSPQEAQQIVGASGDLGSFGTAISALRIFVTVEEGKTRFRLAAVIAPPNGATTVQTNATAQRLQASASTNPVAAQPNRPNPTQPAPGGAQNPNAANDRNLRYPFTLLEIRENDEIPPAPPPPPDPTL